MTEKTQFPINARHNPLRNADGTLKPALTQNGNPAKKAPGIVRRFKGLLVRPVHQITRASNCLIASISSALCTARIERVCARIVGPGNS